LDIAWITPSIFGNTGNDGIVDEYTFGQLQDRQAALSVLENHWQTWIVEDDFKQIKAAGLNRPVCLSHPGLSPPQHPFPYVISHAFHRIPLGYLSIPLTSEDTQLSTDVSPYIPGACILPASPQLAKSYSLNVIVDITAPRVHKTATTTPVNGPNPPCGPRTKPTSKRPSWPKTRRQSTVFWT